MTKMLLAAVLTMTAMFGQDTPKLSELLRPADTLNERGWRKGAVVVLAFETREKNEADLSARLEPEELTAAIDVFYKKDVSGEDETRAFANAAFSRVNTKASKPIQWKKVFERYYELEDKTTHANADSKTNKSLRAGCNVGTSLGRGFGKLTKGAIVIGGSNKNCDKIGRE